MEEATIGDQQEQVFHDRVREYVIHLLLLACLYVLSYLVLRRLLASEADEADGEATVRRVSLGLCTFALSVAVGAALLLPVSVLANEILLLYPSSYYVKWLNSSLVQSLWNHVFLFSNLSFFVLLPFAYFFSESEGVGGQQGLLGRVYEALLVQTLLAVIVLGTAFIVLALVDKSRSAVGLFAEVMDHLPLLYSCVAFVGSVLLLLGTPLGFARLFTVLGQVIVRPASSFLSADVNDEYYAVVFEESCLRQRLKNGARHHHHHQPQQQQQPQQPQQQPQANAELRERLRQLEQRGRQLNRQRRASPFLRRLVYPLCMVLLLFLTTAALLNVLHNTMQLLVGLKALPLNPTATTAAGVSLGLASLSKLGLAGALMEVVLIGYLLAASTVGLYTLPLLRTLRPTVASTPLTRLIVNCGLVLVLSSALPLLARILGISNFDLLGHYGRIEWLGNFYLVLLYNVVFAAAATLCLANKVSNSLLVELWRRLKTLATTPTGGAAAAPGGHAHLLSPVSRKIALAHPHSS